MIFIPCNVPSSKNNQMMIKPGLIISSKRTRDWRKATDGFFTAHKAAFLEATKDKPKPLMIAFQFVRNSKHKFDYINPAQTVQDAMVRHGWIPDDNADEILPSFLPYIYDKSAPGVYISLIN